MANAFAIYFNIFKEILKVVRERELMPSDAHGIGRDAPYGEARRSRARLLNVGEDFAGTDVNDDAGPD